MDSDRTVPLSGGRPGGGSHSAPGASLVNQTTSPLSARRLVFSPLQNRCPLEESAARHNASMDPLTARLEGSIVVLEPLEEKHADGLWEAAQPTEIWDWLAHI